MWWRVAAAAAEAIAANLELLKMDRTEYSERRLRVRANYVVYECM
jgi:hypothetical protein